MLDDDYSSEPSLPAFVSYEWIVYAGFSLVPVGALVSSGFNLYNANNLSELVLFVGASGLLNLAQFTSALLHVNKYGGTLRKAYFILIGIAILSFSVSVKTDSGLAGLLFCALPIGLSWYYTIVCFMDSLKRRAQLSNRS